MNQEASLGGSKPPKVYTEEFRRSVVDHWSNSDKTAAQVAQEFGVKGYGTFERSGLATAVWADP